MPNMSKKEAEEYLKENDVSYDPKEKYQDLVAKVNHHKREIKRGEVIEELEAVKEEVGEDFEIEYPEDAALEDLQSLLVEAKSVLEELRAGKNEPMNDQEEEKGSPLKKKKDPEANIPKGAERKHVSQEELMRLQDEGLLIGFVATDPEDYSKGGMAVYWK